MSITNPSYSNECTTLNILTEICYRAHHIALMEQSDQDWENQEEIKMLKKIVYKSNLRTNLQNSDRGIFLKHCKALSKYHLDEALHDYEKCMNFFMGEISNDLFDKYINGEENPVVLKEMDNSLEISRRKLFGAIWNGIKSAANWIADQAKAAMNALADLASGIIDFLVAAWDAIVAVVKAAASAIYDFAKGLLDTFLSLFDAWRLDIDLKGGIQKMIKVLFFFFFSKISKKLKNKIFVKIARFRSIFDIF